MVCLFQSSNCYGLHISPETLDVRFFHKLIDSSFLHLWPHHLLSFICVLLWFLYPVSLRPSILCSVNYPFHNFASLSCISISSHSHTSPYQEKIHLGLSSHCYSPPTTVLQCHIRVRSPTLHSPATLADSSPQHQVQFFRNTCFCAFC